MTRISCILPTARDSYPIIGLPDLHVLEPTFRSLEKQTFRDFELILVDALYPEKQGWIQKHKWSFPIKYVPVHSNHRFWLNHKRWNVAGQLNTAILHSSGELLVRLDDCSQFSEDYLDRFWRGYQEGYFPLAMHIRYLEGSPARLNQEYKEKGYEAKHSQTLEKGERIEILKRLYGEEGLVRDTRYPIVKQKGGRMTAPINWYYGYSSVTLEAALKVNGYDENFDESKSLEDVDFGSRLSMAGYKNMFLLDTQLQVIEHEHKPMPENIIERNIKPIKCNFALYKLNRRRGRWKANQTKLTIEDLEFIREESLKPPCSPKPHFYADDCQGPLWNLWIESQNIFDLREERLTL